MSAKIQDNHPRIRATKQARIPLFLRLLGEGILISSTPRTPFKKGNLRGRTRVSVAGNRGSVKWLAHYAEYQERGYTTGPVRKYTTPGTGAHFAEQAVRKETANTKQYAKKAGLI